MKTTATKCIQLTGHTHAAPRVTDFEFRRVVGVVARAGGPAGEITRSRMVGQLTRCRDTTAKYALAIAE
jgi:hypothetical protein